MSDKIFIVCKICNTQFSTLRDLSYHLRSHNITKEDYYKTYMAQDDKCGICKECGKPTTFLGLLGYRNFCSLRCAHTNVETKAKKEKTYLEHFGVNHNFKSPEIQTKIKETNIKKYGYENPGQVPDIKEQIKNKFIKKYGTESYMKTDEFRQKSKITCKELYDNEFFRNREKYKNTCLEKYGVASTLQVQQVKDKARKTCLEKYGVEYPSQNNEIKEKIKNNTIERHNGIGFASVDIIKRYLYDDTAFDSSWELAYYIWLKDHNITFEYHPNTYFEYIDTNNIKRRYFPDFKVNNDYIEIKGDFLVEDNIYKMDDNKLKCIQENTKFILYEDDIKKYLNYIKEKYGKNYLQKFRYKK